MQPFRIAICQHRVRDGLKANLAAAAEEIRTAAAGGAAVVVLPEMFICEFTAVQLKASAEASDGLIMQTLSEAAAKYNIWLVGGSFAEADCGTLYNTCPVFAPDGRLVARYRKTHLFDVEINNKNGSSVRSAESEVIKPGSCLVIVDTGFVKMGIAICYDLRFPYIFSAMAEAGAELIVVPAAFSAKTGEAHWENALRSRAVDSQVYVAGAGAAFVRESAFPTYGNSRIVNPWGSVLSAAGSEEEIIYADINPEELMRIRRELPLLKHSREGKLDGVFTFK